MQEPPTLVGRERELEVPRHCLQRAVNGQGELVLAGAVGDPVDGALLVFRADDQSVAEDFARNDPYVLNGLVTRWRVKPWNVVIGGDGQ